MNHPIQDESGQTLTEYAVILAAVVTITLIATLGLLSGALVDMIEAVADSF